MLFAAIPCQPNAYGALSIFFLLRRIDADEFGVDFGGIGVD